MVLPNYQTQFCTTITTTDETIDEDITENINSTSWQIARGTKRRKINKATQNNNPSETTVTIHNRYDLLPNYQNQFCTTTTTTDEAIDEDITENINPTTWQIARGTNGTYAFISLMYWSKYSCGTSSLTFS
jgi:transcription termination factor NusB